MTTHDDIRRIWAKLPGALEGGERFGFGVTVKGKHKGFCWSWAERVDPKKSRVINDEVLAVRTPNLTAKDMLLEGEPSWAVQDPHYNGYPAVLVRLEAIGPDELEDLLVEGWKSLATKDLVREFEKDAP